MATNTEKIVVQVVVKGQGELEKLNKGTKKATGGFASLTKGTARSEEHTSELQSQSTISYAVFCLKKKKYNS